jgi:hypothetical protein
VQKIGLIKDVENNTSNALSAMSPTHPPKSKQSLLQSQLLAGSLRKPVHRNSKVWAETFTAPHIDSKTELPKRHLVTRVGKFYIQNK